jgi:tRNA 2-thiouridine synthesizing protein E
MQGNYAAIRSVPMPAGTLARQPQPEAAQRVALDDPAIAAMTDLAHAPAMVVDPDLDVEGVMRIMIRRNVRSLFVVNDRSEVLGLVTAADVLGVRPPREDPFGAGRADVRARHVMTPQSRLEALRLPELANARVGDVVATLKETGRRHAMVIEEDAGGRPVVRGVFSASGLEAQLGRPVSSAAEAPTFTELRAALARWQRYREIEESARLSGSGAAEAARDPDFPNAPAGWTRESARQAAASEALELGEDHWMAIRALQAYFARHEGIPLRMRELHDALDEAFHRRGGLKYLYTIFPGGPIAQGCRIAGLKVPAGATDQSYGSVA